MVPADVADKEYTGITTEHWTTFIRDLLELVLSQVEAADRPGEVHAPDVEAQEEVWMGKEHPHWQCPQQPFVALLFATLKLAMHLINGRGELANLLAFNERDVQQMVDSVDLLTFLLSRTRPVRRTTSASSPTSRRPLRPCRR
jgi:hypothetical protein